MTDAHGSVKNYYARQVLGDGHIVLLDVRTAAYKDFEEV